jgi:hypothetical protein
VKHIHKKDLEEKSNLLPGEEPEAPSKEQPENVEMNLADVDDVLGNSKDQRPGTTWAGTQDLGTDA